MDWTGMARGVLRVAGLIGAVAGCAHSNDRSTVGHPDLAGAFRVAAFTDEGTGGAVPVSDGPSLTGMSRADWAPATVLVPVDGVAALRTYAPRHHWTDETARQRGDYPTAVTALELDGATYWTQVAEGGAAPFLAFADAFALPFRMVMAAPWREVRTIPEPYWRAPVSIPRRVGTASAPTEVTTTPAEDPSAAAGTHRTK